MLGLGTFLFVRVFFRCNGSLCVLEFSMIYISSVLFDRVTSGDIRWDVRLVVRTMLRHTAQSAVAAHMLM